jgi:hypothetical protein
MSTLCLHRGGFKVSRDTLADLPTPEPTETHFPIAHHQLVTATMDELTRNGFEITKETHALHQDADRYFELLDIRNGNNAPDWGLTIGLRNSHDKAFASGLAIGSTVFVCDNTAFSSEVVLQRKHTRFIERDLPQLVHRAMGQLMDHRGKMHELIDAMQHTPLDDRGAHDLVIRALDAKVIGIGRIDAVLEDWRKPRHEEFQPRNQWSMFNAFTETLKTYCADAMLDRSQRLHSIFAAAV